MASIYLWKHCVRLALRDSSARHRDSRRHDDPRSQRRRARLITKPYASLTGQLKRKKVVHATQSVAVRRQVGNLRGCSAGRTAAADTCGQLVSEVTQKCACRSCNTHLRLSGLTRLSPIFEIAAQSMAAATMSLPALPPALTGTDDDPFTRHSILARLPAIIDETIAGVADSLGDEGVRELRSLQEEIRGNAVLRPLAPGQREVAWRGTQAAVGMHSADGTRHTWLSSPWFYVENYMYKRILDICEPRGVHDPFQHQKDKALESASRAFLDTVLPLFQRIRLGDEEARKDMLASAVYRSLWGNRADLSLSGGKVAASEHHAPDHDADLLVDNVPQFIAHLEAHSQPSVCIVLDNCGLELLTDLVLAATLLAQGFAASVSLVAKTAPVFVSDAMIKDVTAHVEYLRNLADEAEHQVPLPAYVPVLRALHEFLTRAMETGSLAVHEHEFFTSPHPMWDMPDDLRARLKHASTTIFKGDATYRRLLGDRHWPHTTPFEDVIAYMPAPIMALRTCKAGLICGITKAAEERARARHPTDWLVSGTYGVVHFAVGTAS